MIAPALALLTALTVLGATPGRSPSPDEERLFGEGTKAYQAGDAAAAERAFTSGYQLGQDPAFLVHIGEAQEKQGRAAEAAASYRRYLQAAPDAADRADVEQRIRRLEPAPAAAGPDPTETPGELGVGSATPNAAPLPGAPTPAPGVLPPASPPAYPVQATDVGEEERPEARRSPLSRRLIIAGAVTAVASVALLVTAAAFGAAASSKSSDVTHLISFTDEHTGLPKEYADVAGQYEQAVNDGRRYDDYAKGFAIAAAGSAGLAAVLLGLGYGLGSHAAEPSVALAPGGASAGLTWRFQ